METIKCKNQISAVEEKNTEKFGEFIYLSLNILKIFKIIIIINCIYSFLFN